MSSLIFTHMPSLFPAAYSGPHCLVTDGTVWKNLSTPCPDSSPLTTFKPLISISKPLSSFSNTWSSLLQNILPLEHRTMDREWLLASETHGEPGLNTFQQRDSHPWRGESAFFWASVRGQLPLFTCSLSQTPVLKIQRSSALPGDFGAPGEGGLLLQGCIFVRKVVVGKTVFRFNPSLFQTCNMPHLSLIITRFLEEFFLPSVS